MFDLVAWHGENENDYEAHAGLSFLNQILGTSADFRGIHDQYYELKIRSGDVYVFKHSENSFDTLVVDLYTASTDQLDTISLGVLWGPWTGPGLSKNHASKRSLEPSDFECPRRR
jgi:hypothetical protein